MFTVRPLLMKCSAILVCWLWTAAPATAVTFTTDTLIVCSDMTYDGQDIIVDGCVLTVNCAHTFNSLRVINGGAVTHSAGVAGFDLTITGDLTVYAGGSISANGKGYGGNSGPGAGGGGSGGGYGGTGGGSAGGSIYGSITEPPDLGSGGGSGGYGASGGGGGAIRLAVGGTLTVDGSLTANGNAAYMIAGFGAHSITMEAEVPAAPST